jgi:hypothetical protein
MCRLQVAHEMAKILVTVRLQREELTRAVEVLSDDIKAKGEKARTHSAHRGIFARKQKLVGQDKSLDDLVRRRPLSWV